MTRIPLRWRIAGLLFVGAAINYFDRACLSIVSPAIKQQLGIGDAEMGLVFSSFFVGYALMNVIGGWAADRFGAKRVLGLSLVAWSLFCAATAAAQGFASLLVLRVLFGAAEGPFGATSATVVSRWFPKREISRAIAAIASGTAAGAVVAGPIVALAFALLGWRGALVVVSLFGVSFALLWSRYAPAAPAPIADLAGAQPTTPTDTREATKGVSLIRLLVSPPIIANALAYFAYTYLFAVYLSWLPLFLTARYRFRIESAALGSALPWIMAFVGIWAGALLSEGLLRRTGRPLFAKRVVQVGALVVAGLGTVALGLVESSFAAIGIASVSLFALYLSGTSFWAVVQDVVAVRAIGTVSGFTHLVANFGGIAGPAITGMLVQQSGSFRSAWLTAGLVAVGAGACVTAAMRFDRRSRSVDAPLTA